MLYKNPAPQHHFFVVFFFKCLSEVKQKEPSLPARRAVKGSLPSAPGLGTALFPKLADASHHHKELGCFLEAPASTSDLQQHSLTDKCHQHTEPQPWVFIGLSSRTLWSLSPDFSRTLYPGPQLLKNSLFCAHGQGARDVLDVPDVPVLMLLICSSEDRPGDRLHAHHHHHPGGQTPGCCRHLQGHTGAAQPPQGRGHNPKCIPRPSLLDLRGPVPSGTAGQGQGQGAPGGIGSTRKVLPRQDQSLSRKPIPCLATHFPAVQTGTTFAPCANPRLCRKSPFGDTPALSQPPSQGLEGHWHQQRDWDICHHTASDKSLFPVLQYLCLPIGWCLGMANSSQIKNITSQWWCHFTDGIFQVAVQ